MPFQVGSFIGQYNMIVLFSLMMFNDDDDDVIDDDGDVPGPLLVLTTL